MRERKDIIISARGLLDAFFTVVTLSIFIAVLVKLAPDIVDSFGREPDWPVIFILMGIASGLIILVLGTEQLHKRNPKWVIRRVKLPKATAKENNAETH